ncbi:MAG: efflux transporter periplasmic adaptor subunit [Arcobacter sp.]|nr:MAG: efflux transporter periplasmic adaptor subunit [Arcobacter sp.]
MKTLLALMALLLSLNAQEIYTTFIVKANESADLAFDAGGIISHVHVEISQGVKKGEILAELKNDDGKANVNMAKAEVKNAEIVLNFATRDYARQVKVKHLIDEARFDVYALSLQKAEVTLKQVQAKLDYQRALLDKTKLRAPFDGVIFEKDIEIGDVVSGLMLTTVFKIQSNTKRKLIISFDQKYWKKVKVGQEYKYRVDGDPRIHKAKISKLYPSANLKNRKIQAEVEVSGFVVGLIGDGHILVNDK